MPENWQRAGFGLYIHWPFCASKCPYCDFNSHVAASIDQTRWQAAYLSEISRVSAETPDRILSSIYFGGGTPSLMDPDLVASIIEAARNAWTFANNIEITLEANPGSVEAGRFRGYRDAGVNRVSLGVQALNDADLRSLGRLHSAAEARAALEIARNTFDRVNFDLIYARQNQELSAWRSELREALLLAGDHLSLYQLTIEDGTAFGDRFQRGNLRGLPDEDLAADMYFATQEICEDAGFSAYEVSNHAKLGCESVHNLIYWRGGDWAGIGPGAHGRLSFSSMRIATETPLNPASWLSQVEQTGSGEAARENLAVTDQVAEYLMMSLRISEGADMARIEELAGRNPISSNKINMLRESGLIRADRNSLQCTATGRPVLNAILREVLPD